MSEPPLTLQGSIARIVITLRGAEADMPTLEALARLAAFAQAELQGFFVEDDALFRAAALPVAKAFSRAGAPQPLDPAALSQALARESALAQRTLSRLAEQAGVRWTFRTIRGVFATEVKAAAAEADLVALGVARRKTTLPLPEGRGRRAATVSGNDRPLAVVYTRSAAAQRALRLAVHLAETLKRRLVVLVLARTEGAAQALRARAEAEIAPLKAAYGRLIDPDVAALAAKAREVRPVLLIIEAGPAALDPEAVRVLNDELDTPSLLVR